MEHCEGVTVEDKNDQSKIVFRCSTGDYDGLIVLQKRGLRGRKALPFRAGMDSPLILKYFSWETSFNDASDAPPQLERGLNGTVGGAPTVFPFLSRSEPRRYG